MSEDWHSLWGKKYLPVTQSCFYGDPSREKVKTELFPRPAQCDAELRAMLTRAEPAFSEEEAVRALPITSGHCRGTPGLDTSFMCLLRWPTCKRQYVNGLGLIYKLFKSHWLENSPCRSLLCLLQQICSCKGVIVSLSCLQVFLPWMLPIWEPKHSKKHLTDILLGQHLRGFLRVNVFIQAH